MRFSIAQLVQAIWDNGFIPLASRTVTVTTNNDKANTPGTFTTVQHIYQSVTLSGGNGTVTIAAVVSLAKCAVTHAGCASVGSPIAINWTSTSTFDVFTDGGSGAFNMSFDVVEWK